MKEYYEGMFSSLKHNIILQLNQIEGNIEYSGDADISKDIEFIEKKCRDIKEKFAEQKKSACCNATMIDDSDMCSSCKEHTCTISEEEYLEAKEVVKNAYRWGEPSSDEAADYYHREINEAEEIVKEYENGQSR